VTKRKQYIFKKINFIFLKIKGIFPKIIGIFFKIKGIFPKIIGIFFKIKGIILSMINVFIFSSLQMLNMNGLKIDTIKMAKKRLFLKQNVKIKIIQIK